MAIGRVLVTIFADATTFRTEGALVAGSERPTSSTLKVAVVLSSKARCSRSCGSTIEGAREKDRDQAGDESYLHWTECSLRCDRRKSKSFFVRKR